MTTNGWNLARPRIGPTKRRDLNAFLLLERILPGEGDMVSGAEHDEIFLGVDLEEFAKVATEEDVKNLIRCGVRFDDYREGFAMFA